MGASMDETQKQALSYLASMWHTGISGTSDSADLLSINSNTFATRIKRKQALVLRESGGRERASVTLTGFHLVYNLLADRMLRYGISLDLGDGSWAKEPYVYAEWARKEILSEPWHTNAMLRLIKHKNGEVAIFTETDGFPERHTQNAQVIIPIGSMVTTLAAKLYMRSLDNERASRAAMPD